MQSLLNMINNFKEIVAPAVDNLQKILQAQNIFQQRAIESLYRQALV